MKNCGGANLAIICDAKRYDRTIRLGIRRQAAEDIGRRRRLVGPRFEFGRLIDQRSHGLGGRRCLGELEQRLNLTRKIAPADHYTSPLGYFAKNAGINGLFQQMCKSEH